MGSGTGMRISCAPPGSQRRLVVNVRTMQHPSWSVARLDVKMITNIYIYIRRPLYDVEP